MPNKPKSTPTATLRKHRIRGAKHGKTFCTYCTAKIARGMQFCNPAHRAAFKG